MVEHCWLAQRFDEHRPHLRALAYRMLGSSSDAEDVVQDAWLRLNRTGSSGIDNLGGWLTTVVARVCLNMLRSREARREEPLGSHEPEPDSSRSRGTDLEQEMVLADSVGLALLVVLDTLGPSERPAFVLHDMFDVPFKEIASIVDCSPSAARQLASRGRRRVQGRPAIPEKNLARRRAVVDAFLAASRGGDFHALLAVLDPDVVLRVDRAALPTGATREFQGAAAVAKQALAYSARSRFARPALVNGAVGVVVAPHGRLVLVLGFEFASGKIARIDVIADAELVDDLTGIRIDQRHNAIKPNVSFGVNDFLDLVRRGRAVFAEHESRSRAVCFSILCP